MQNSDLSEIGFRIIDTPLPSTASALKHWVQKASGPRLVAQLNAALEYQYYMLSVIL
jgi:hypothetical protein